MAEPFDPIDVIVKNNPWLSGPSDFLVEKLADQFKDEPTFKKIFGDRVDIYERNDYPARSYPALRVFSERERKDHESHYINGSITIDAIMPPAMRRDEFMLVGSRVANALIQQLRRPKRFAALREDVPGLNELGKTVDVDRSLLLRHENSTDYAPMIRLEVNFRIDLKEWDAYLERDDRTVNDPFERTLGDLERLVGVIQGLKDDKTVNVTVPVDQQV